MTRHHRPVTNAKEPRDAPERDNADAFGAERAVTSTDVIFGRYSVAGGDLRRGELTTPADETASAFGLRRS
jgi:hypothetical protein